MTAATRRIDQAVADRNAPNTWGEKESAGDDGKHGAGRDRRAGLTTGGGARVAAAVDGILDADGARGASEIADDRRLMA